ncbi:MAG: leucine-rich repeat domain-containing protein, partial [Ruminococcus sp.]|nr:leucine-rich repeat domain-containing protein [Ruminococcus sp.]
MKNINKLVSIVLTLLLILSVMITVPVTVSAATDTDTYGTWTYSISNNQAAITAWSAPSNFNGIVVIPSSLGGYPVTSLGKQAFRYKTGYQSITSVTFPDTCTNTGEEAFADCTSLSSITFGSGITEITRYSFYNTALTSVTIPETVTAIYWGAFEQSRNLQSVTIPASVTSMQGAVFNSCTSLTSLTIYARSFSYSTDRTLNNCPVTVRGYSGSSAQNLASAFSKTFVALSENTTETSASEASEPNQTIPELVSSLNYDVDYVSGSSSNVSINNTACNIYTFKASKNGVISVYSNTGGSYTDTYGYLCDSNNSILTSDDDSAGSGHFKITYTVTANTIYKIASRPYSTSSSVQFKVYLEYLLSENGFTYEVNNNTAKV